MSGNRRKNTPPQPVDAAEDSAASRLVVLAKTAEPNGAKTEAKPQKPRQERIGDILRQARMDRADDLHQIAEYLCIKPAFLIALENSNYEEFPADAYVIGFLRTYANFLGIDGKAAIDRYRYEMAGRRKKPVLSMPNSLSEGRAPSALILVGATIAALLIYALWYGISSANRAQTHIQPAIPAAALVPAGNDADATAGLSAPIAPTMPTPAPSHEQTTENQIPTPPPTASTPVVIAPVPATTLASAPTTAPEGIVVTAPKTDVGREPPAKNTTKRTTNAGDTSSRLTIRATQSSWVMVTDSSGKAIFDHVMKSGDSYKVPNVEGLSLTTGNGSGLTLSLDGTDLAKVSSGAPHIVRDIPLDPDRLAAGSAPTER